MYVVQIVGRPTFYLHPNVQGIVDNDHARRIAQDIVGPGVNPDHIFVMLIDFEDEGDPENWESVDA